MPYVLFIPTLQNPVYIVDIPTQMANFHQKYVTYILNHKSLHFKKIAKLQVA